MMDQLRNDNYLPNRKSFGQEFHAKILLMAAAHATRVRKFEEALAFAKRAQEVCSSPAIDVKVGRQLSRIAMKRDDYEHAAMYIDQALSAKPFNAQTHYLRAMVYKTLYIRGRSANMLLQAIVSQELADMLERQSRLIAASILPAYAVSPRDEVRLEIKMLQDAYRNNIDEQSI